MNSIILTTLNARYSHTSIGLRYLFANLKELQSDAAIIEFTINDNVQDIAEKLLAEQPHIVAMGVYIWNVIQVSELIHTLKKISPQTYIILGGPEVSYDPMRVNMDVADYIIRGEGEIAFHTLCKAIVDGNQPSERIIDAGTVNLNDIELPYRYYSDEDVRNRYIYVEASRGCPFSCEFCLSSMDNRVRNLFIDRLLEEFELLWQRGVRNFKFIDRTFNLNPKISNQILDFFLAKDGDYFAHFEVIPDHFPLSIQQRIKQFKPASLQLEVGIQTLNNDVATRIHRKLNIEKIKENIAFLEHETHAHMHLDLIVGLPGENLESFGKGLNQLCSLTHAEIQIGILKNLSGTSLSRHNEVYGMVYSDIPPYDIIKTNDLSFEDIQKMKRFARFWNLYKNSGNFKLSLALLWSEGGVFESFFAFSIWIYKQTNSTWHISLDRLAKLLFGYLNNTGLAEPQHIADCLVKDLMKIEGRVLPAFLRPYVPHTPKTPKNKVSGHNKRQLRHL
ncbi:MAG: B12-binding domain-containing radical SAM protein [Proteobacteria bacterium]|nr:MAG: B12-binding domain-containing radical SAM protein [Pseudomonadota bacterium]